MSTTPRLSIIVPSRDRPDKLERLIACLARQDVDENNAFEVIVALDGAPGGGRAALPTGAPFDLAYIELDTVGISAAKNAAVTRSRGDILLLINDDIEPESDFVREHARAQAAGHPIVLGHSPWMSFANETVFDLLVGQSRMVFFYHELQPGRHYDFRHAWNLNLSVQRSRLSALAGPFAELLRPVYYDDVEMAYRLMGREDQVYFHEPARAPHNHRFTPAAYFRREALLGLMAVALHGANRPCFEAIFGAPLPVVVEQAQRALEVDVRDSQRCLRQWLQAVSQPAKRSASSALIDALYLAHLPLKRRAWRRGLIRAIAGPDTPWPQRGAVAADVLGEDVVFAEAAWSEDVRCPVG